MKSLKSSMWIIRNSKESIESVLTSIVDGTPTNFYLDLETAQIDVLPAETIWKVTFDVRKEQ
jgi:hypothetical protein